MPGQKHVPHAPGPQLVLKLVAGDLRQRHLRRAGGRFVQTIHGGEIFCAQQFFHRLFRKSLRILRCRDMVTALATDQKLLTNQAEVNLRRAQLRKLLQVVFDRRGRRGNDRIRRSRDGRPFARPPHGLPLQFHADAHEFFQGRQEPGGIRCWQTLANFASLSVQPGGFEDLAAVFIHQLKSVVGSHEKRAV